MAQIVLIEDEDLYRTELAAFLSSRGHTTHQCSCLADFYPIMDKAEVAIIDLNLPDGLGFEAVARLRDSDLRAGIILLTARGATPDKLEGFTSGADHYLVKPVQLLELDAIVSALLRRVAKGWRLNSVERLLSSPEEYSEKLAPIEVKLFELIAASKTGVVSRKELVEAMGLNWISYDQRKLDTQISRLRHRWAEKSGQTLPLQTEHRLGYSFGAAIQIV